MNNQEKIMNGVNVNDWVMKEGFVQNSDKNSMMNESELKTNEISKEHINISEIQEKRISELKNLCYEQIKSINDKELPGKVNFLRFVIDDLNNKGTEGSVANNFFNREPRKIIDQTTTLFDLNCLAEKYSTVDWGNSFKIEKIESLGDTVTLRDLMNHYFKKK